MQRSIMQVWSDVEELNEYEREILENIDEFGWFCTSVYRDEHLPLFSYTIGFTETLSAPEFIVCGLDGKLSHNLLWTVFRQLEAGHRLRDGDRWANLVVGYDCILRDVHPTNIIRDYFNSAIWYHGPPELNGPLKAMQIVWPDADGIFPWEPGCTQWVCDDQLPLYLPRPQRH